MIEQILRPFGELVLYQDYAQKISDGLRPYIDFKPEYPPLALNLFSMANVFGSGGFTLMWYLMVALATLGTIVVIKKLKGNAWIFLACVLPLGGLFWDRFDIFPAFFVLLSIFLVKKGKYFGAIYLAIAVLIKIYPIIFLPFLLLIYLFNGGIKKAIYAFVLFLITMFLFIYPVKECINVIFSYHGNRGIQIESIRAMPLLFKENSLVEFKHSTFEIRKEIK